MPQKNRRSVNENRWEMMKYNNTINNLHKIAQKSLNSLKVWGKIENKQ